MIKEILRIALSFVSLAAMAQSPQYLVSPKNNYSSISSYSEGLARVEMAKGSVSFLATSGERAFKNTFEYAGNFHCGRAYVRKTIDGVSMYGFIDKKGKLVIPYSYNEVEDFSDNRAAVLNRKGFWQIINREGKVIMSDSMIITEMEVKNVYDSTQRWEGIEPPKFCNGLMQVRKNKKYGFVDTSGHLVVPCQYDYVSDFNGGFALAHKTIQTEIFAAKSMGWQSRSYDCLIDTLGNEIFRFKEQQNPDYLLGVSNGMILFFNDNHQMGFMNVRGKIIVPDTLESLPFMYSDGVCIEQIHGQRSDNKDGYMQVIDTIGKVMAKIPFTNKYGTMYDSNHQFHEGLLAVKINDKWGYMTKLGKMIIPPQFASALNFHEGLAVVVTENGKVSVIKKTEINKINR